MAGPQPAVPAATPGRTLNPSDHPAALVVGVYGSVWVAFGAASGWVANRVPRSRLTADGPLTRLRRWERGGRCYERVAIRRWKDRLPEAGALFAGGTSKRALPGSSQQALDVFAAETRRAELVHWAQIAFAGTFFLWNPFVVGWAMIAFAAAAHLPFIAVQRFNRARVHQIGARRRHRIGGVDALPPTEQHGGVDDTPSPDPQAEAETLDEETLGEEELQSEGLRAHDLDLVDSVRDRAVREEPDFDRRRPRADHTAAQLVAPRNGTDPVADVFGLEMPADGARAAEESAMHLEDEGGRAI